MRKKRVIILGGGIGGLSAAQELAERGFDVTIYEASNVFGGKARSISVPNTGVDGRKDLPGEHGFRFFPSFYKHVVDTMKRIPFGPSPGTVFDNLVAATRAHLARAGQSALVLSARFPRDPGDWVTTLRALFATDLAIPAGETLFFIDRLLILMTSCPERRLAEYENLSWWDFLDADNKSVHYRRVLAQGQSRSLVAARAERCSTRTLGYIFLQLISGLIGFGDSFDLVLNGPTNDVWIDPWVAYLKQLGVEMNTGAVLRTLHTDGGQITRVTIEQSGQLAQFESDYYICAVPVEIMAALLTDELKAAAPSVSNLASLQTAWMNGIQFYLDTDIPITHGHSVYVDSPWALTSVSQKQFWKDFDLEGYGDGRVRGILSACISEWEAPGMVFGKPASSCTPEEIKTEVWAQIRAHLNEEQVAQLDKAQLLYWFLDPAIRFSGFRGVTNSEPLLINTVGSYQYRPEAYTELRNLFLASDYVRTFTDVASMEAANEAARRAVNAILADTMSPAPRAEIWPLEEPDFFKPLLKYDQMRFQMGLPHSKLAS
ncbi:MAG TPA: FAD-dependent oxidoreductase [Bryobacteraceae bacterium]|nr:FAD-dependent oxidoreductase [Bryobacteraceae bacterium]